MVGGAAKDAKQRGVTPRCVPRKHRDCPRTLVSTSHRPQPGDRHPRHPATGRRRDDWLGEYGMPAIREAYRSLIAE